MLGSCYLCGDGVERLSQQRQTGMQPIDSGQKNVTLSFMTTRREELDAEWQLINQQLAALRGRCDMPTPGPVDGVEAELIERLGEIEC